MMIVFVYHLCLSTVQYFPDGLDDSYSNEECTIQSKHILECRKTSPDSQFLDTSDPYGISVNVSTIENAVKDPLNFVVELPVSYSFLSPTSSQVSFPSNSTNQVTFPEYCETKQVRFSNDAAYSDKVWLVCVDDSEGSHSFSIYQGTESFGTITWQETIFQFLQLWPFGDDGLEFRFYKISINKMNAYNNWMMTRIDFLFDTAENPTKILGNFIFLNFFGSNKLYFFNNVYFEKYSEPKTDYFQNIFLSSSSVSGFDEWTFPSYSAYSVGTSGITTLHCTKPQECAVDYYIFSDFLSLGNNVSPRQTITISNLDLIPDNPSKWIDASPPSKSIGIACSTTKISENGKCFHQVVILPNNNGPGVGMDKYYAFTFETDFAAFNDVTIDLASTSEVYAFRKLSMIDFELDDHTQSFFDDTRLVNGEGIDFMYEVSSVIRDLPSGLFYRDIPRCVFMRILSSEKNWDDYTNIFYIYLVPFFTDPVDVQFFIGDVSTFFQRPNTVNKISGIEKNLFLEVSDENIFQQCEYDVSILDLLGYYCNLFQAPCSSDMEFEIVSASDLLQLKACTFHLGTAGAFHFDYFGGQNIIIKESFEDAVSEDLSPIQKVQMMNINTTTSVDLIVGPTESTLIVSTGVQSVHELIEVSSNRICLGRRLIRDGIQFLETVTEYLFLYYIVDDDTDPTNYVFHSIAIPSIRGSIDPNSDFIRENATLSKTLFPATFDLLCNQGEDAFHWDVGIFDFDTGFAYESYGYIEVDFDNHVFDGRIFIWKLYVIETDDDDFSYQISSFQEEQLSSYDLIDIEFRTHITDSFVSDSSKFTDIAAALFEDSGNYTFCSFLKVDLFAVLQHHCFDFSPEYRNFTEFECGHLSLTVTQHSIQESHETQSSAVSFMCNGTNDDGDLTRSWFYSFESKTLHLLTDDGGPFDTKATTGYDTVFIKTIPDTTGKLNNFKVVGVDHNDPDDIFFATRYNIETGIFSVFVTSNYDASEEWNQNALADAIQVTFPVAASLTISLYSRDPNYPSPFVSSETQENTLDDSNSPVSNFGPALQFEDLSQLSRLAVEKKITQANIIVQENFVPFYSIIHPSYTFPILDDIGLGIIYFFPSLESNFTLLLKADNKHEKNIFNFLDDRNVLWTECPENNENSFAFFTTDSLTSCNVGPPNILSNFDQNAATRLSTMRLEQTIDDDMMLCFGASSVVYGNECGQHPLIHTSTEDCATEDDPFVCVDGNNEIFAFDTVVQNVTTLCLSMSGTCAAIGAFTPDDQPGQTLEECRELCVNTTDPTATCAFFEHVNEDCTLYLRSDVDNPFLGEPCENGVLGFICRLEGSDDVLSSQLILNDGDDIAFRTEIYQGQTLKGTLPHGEIDASTMKMDRSGKETAFVLEFQSSFNVTGGQVIYVCGQDEDVYNGDSTDDRVLFTHPASEDDHFVNTTVQECYISTHSLTFHEKRLANSADPTIRSCIDKQASGVFFAQGVNEDGPFKFYNIKPSTSTSKSSGPATSSSFSASVVDEQWTPHSESFVTFAVPPGKNLSSVIAYSSPSPYAPNDRFFTKYWHTYLVSPTNTAPNEIRPVRLERVEGSESTTVHGAGASVSIDPSDPPFMFGIENSTDPDISDVLWGRFLNFKAYFFQEKETISKSEEIEFIHKYIFSMSEAFSRKMCPGFDVNNTNTSETFPDGECVMTRLSHPVMRPLFSEQVRMRDGTLALGFTPYRVAPFMGVYIDDDSTERMVMPDDAFIEEHGGIGFGAASSVDEFENQTVYSFGGFDYGPDPTFRPFEKLQFTTDDATLQWQPVWHRESQTFGCKDDTVQCTYSEDFYDNVLPQSNLGTVHHKLSTQMHVTGHAHSPNEFWHFVTQRNFQFPSVRDSAKCGPGDVTVNLNRLDDVNTGPTLEKITESNNCNNELKIRVPLTPEKDVDFSSDNSFFDSQTSVYNFFISPVPDDNRINLMTMLFQNTRKNPEFLKLWPALLNLSSFDLTNYKLLPLHTTQTWAKECIAKRGTRMHEHEGSRGDGHYSDCYPQDTGTMLFLFKDRPGATSDPQWVSNDCDKTLTTSDILDRFQYKKQSTPNQYSWEITFSGDSSFFNPSTSTPSQTYWTIEGGAVQAFLYFLNNTNSDIPFLARECEVGNLALIKMIGFFDAPNTQFKNPDVMFEKYNPNTNGDFDLSKVYTPDFFTDVFDCLHTTIYLGHNNDHLKQFCNEREFLGEGSNRRFSWYNVDETSTPTPGNINTVWPKVSSGHKFKFPSKVVNGFTSASDAVPTGANGATCGKEMCLSPFPALLPPFQRNCDFYNLATLPSKDIEWRKCPMMPNQDFYESSQTNGDTGDDIFFKRQIWRHPAFWSKDSGVWSSKAYRYNINKFDPNPKKIKKVFKSVVDGPSANSTVIGQLQCSRSGGVSKQSIIDPDLFYICGGVSYTEILSGCSLCEVFDVNTGKGASITGIDATDFSVCGNKNIIGLDIQQGISSPTNPFALQWVVGQFSCAPDTSLFDESPRVKQYSKSYLSIPDPIKEIHYAKTSDHTGIKSVSFHQVELVSERGTMRALPLYASSFSTSMTGPGSVCFESGKASVFLEYKKAKDGDLIASINVNGFDVTASTSSETTVKHITPGEMTCIDANGITESNGTRIIGFWMMDKVSPDDNIFVDLEILTLNTSEYSFSSQPRSFYFDKGSDMQTQFSNIRWKTTKGFHQNPEPPVVWACKVLDSGPVCGSDVNCSSGTGCIVEYYDDASSSVKDETELNIGNNLYQDFGYLDQPEQLHCYSGSQFKAYPLNFTLVPGTFGQDSCDEERKLEGDDFQMVLVQRYVLERMKEPHFTEGAPRMMIRTSEACSDNTTQCHTFQRTDLEDDAAQRLCFHAVGCEKDEYVNVTSDEPEYECEAFEKCTEFVTGKYQNMGTHAGFRPECTLVQACSEPGFYRHHSPFDTELGQVVLGQCQSKTSCGSTAFTQDASTALKDSTCVEFQNCDFSTQFQSSSGDRDQDRQCIETTTCTEGQITLRDATRTSDTVCVNVSIQCEYDASQFFDQDSNGCKDATICGVKEIETASLTATTDRVCTQLPECSFYEVEVPGSGLQFECLVQQHASKTEEIAMMAAAGSVGILSCLFYLLFSNQDDTQRR